MNFRIMNFSEIQEFRKYVPEEQDFHVERQQVVLSVGGLGCADFCRLCYLGSIANIANEQSLVCEIEQEFLPAGSEGPCMDGDIALYMC